MDWHRTVRTLGIRFLIGAATVLVVFLGLAIDRHLRRPDRDLRQELVNHHFERSSWFALNAEKYAELDPDLTRQFKEVAAWHANRAHEFQRMGFGDVVPQAERDLEHDKVDGHLIERAAKYNPILRKRRAAANQADRDGSGARTASPESGRRCD
jgi:hypothetical protein